jgi:hypothetical protein
MANTTMRSRHSAGRQTVAHKNKTQRRANASLCLDLFIRVKEVGDTDFATLSNWVVVTVALVITRARDAKKDIRLRLPPERWLVG